MTKVFNSIVLIAVLCISAQADQFNGRCSENGCPTDKEVEAERIRDEHTKKIEQRFCPIQKVGVCPKVEKTSAIFKKAVAVPGLPLADIRNDRREGAAFSTATVKHLTWGIRDKKKEWLLQVNTAEGVAGNKSWAICHRLDIFKADDAGTSSHRLQLHGDCKYSEVRDPRDSPPTFEPYNSVDLDGDGSKELVVKETGSATWVLRAYKSTSDGWSEYGIGCWIQRTLCP